MKTGAILITLVLLSAPARADDARAARQHFTAGSSLYDLGKFKEAAAEYELAYQAKNDPALLFNIGQAYRGAGEHQKAITAYRSYLRHVPNARNRDDVEGLIARAQKQLDAEEAQREEQRRQKEQAVVAPPPSPPPPVTVAHAEKPPLYKRWWLWTAVGGVVAVGVAVGVGVAYAVPKDAPAPANALTVSF